MGVEQNDARKMANKDSKLSPIVNNVMGGNGTTPNSLVGILDFNLDDEEGLLPLSPPSNNNGLLLSPEFESNRVIARRTTFRVDRKSTGMFVLKILLSYFGTKHD